MGLEMRAIAGSGHHHHHHQPTSHISLPSPLPPSSTPIPPSPSAFVPFAAATTRVQWSSESELEDDDDDDEWGDKSWTVDCPCGVNFDDGDEMVECDSCGVWVHTSCCRVPKGLATFVCDKCKSKKKSEDEVVQLLVDFPNTARPRNPVPKMNRKAGEVSGGARVYASEELPIEQRAHVHGVPGGDAKIFFGASKILRQLWKHSGYIPKIFQVEYDEFSDLRGAEIETCLFSIKATTEKAEDVLLETADKVEVVECREEKQMDTLNSEERPSKKDSAGKLETQKLDSFRQSKNRQRVRGVKEERLQQHSKHGQDENLGKDEICKKRLKISPAEIDSPGDVINQRSPSLSASQQMSPKNPKAMKKTAVQEFLDGDMRACSKCERAENLFSAEIVEQSPSEDPKILLCRDCENDSNAPRNESYQHGNLVPRDLPKVVDLSTDTSSRHEVVELNAQDIKMVIHPVESSSTQDKRDNFDQVEEVHVVDRDDTELKDQKIDCKRKQLEGQLSLESVIQSALENTKKVDVIRSTPSTVLNGKTGCPVGPTFETEDSAMPARTIAVDNLAESTYLKLNGPSLDRIELQSEHCCMGPLPATPSSHALPILECEDVLQHFPSGIASSDQKQSSSAISNFARNKVEESTKGSVPKFSIQEEPSQQPWKSSGASSQLLVGSQHQDDPLALYSVNAPSDSNRLTCGKSPHSDTHQIEVLDARSPPKSHEEFNHLHDIDTMSQGENNSNIDTYVQPGAQCPLSLHRDIKEMIPASAFQSPKISLQQQAPKSPNNQKTAALPLPLKNSYIHTSTKSPSIHLEKPPSRSGVKSIASSSLSGGSKIVSAAKQPGRVVSPQSRRPDSVNLSSFKSTSGLPPGGATTLSTHNSRNDMKPPTNVTYKSQPTNKTSPQSHTSKLAPSAPKTPQTLPIPKQSGHPAAGKKVSLPVSSTKSTVTCGARQLKSSQVSKEEKLDSCPKEDKTQSSSVPACSKTAVCPAPPPPSVTIPHSTVTVSAIPTTALNDEELALLLHQELNSSPRVPRVPRVRQLVMSPKRGLSIQSTSTVVKGASIVSMSASAGGSSKENSAWRKRTRDDRHKDGSKQSIVGDESNKSCEPAAMTTPTRIEEDNGISGDGGSRGQPPMTQSHKDVHPKEPAAALVAPPQTASVSVARSSSPVESGRLDNIIGEKKNVSDVPLTISGLISEFLSSKEVPVSYESLCDATLPHWQRLLKANGERYTYLKHRQAVYDCLKSNISWSHLIDHSPKMASCKRKHRYDSSSATEIESEEDADLGSSYSLEHLDFRRPGKLLRTHESERARVDKQKDPENHLDDVPKGKRNVRRRRKLAIEDESEDDEDYAEKIKKVSSKPILQGKSGAVEHEIPFSVSDEDLTNSSEGEEEMMVRGGVRKTRKRIERGNSSEGDGRF